MKDRQYDIDTDRIWKCPTCGHEEQRHHAKRKRPFCDPCDWQYAVLYEMVPYKNGEKVTFND